MKKYLVIGNPIDHSLSPKLHNYWIEQNKIKASYEKKLLHEEGLKQIINEIEEDKISGINITVPFKKSIIPFLSELTPIAKKTESVNTVYKKNNKIVGDNTDVGGFKKALENTKYNVRGQKAFILGAGGVVPSIILGLKEMGISEITVSNRTKEKSKALKKKYPDLNLVNWGETVSCDIIINATSLGLKDEEIRVDFAKIGKNKLFYDVVYNPAKTKFLLNAKKFDHIVENGLMMFVHQARLAFKIWHGVEPSVDDNIIKTLEND